MPSSSAEGDYMKRFLGILSIGSWILVSNACLKVETSHVLYLAPSGAVTWTVHDRDVHSGEEDPAKRAQEESVFLFAVQHHAHGPLLALEALGGRNATTELTRTERPWEALTSARFDRIDTLAASLLRELGVQGRASLSSAGDRNTLRVQWIEEEPVAEETPVFALVEELESYRVVLTKGRFVAAEGFAISPDGRVATPAEEPQSVSTSERVVSLTWTVEG
jgi:hypothetical protein